MNTVGEKAPDFEGETFDGKKIRLSDFRGKSVVLYFYPKDNTPGCTKEACGFNEHLKEFDALNSQIIGVSVDGPKSHKTFTEKYDLKFLLLSDKDRKISKTYGVLSLFRTSKRSTFIIDREGKIAHAFPQVKVKGHIDEVLEKIR
ncbi:peroxiredoxin [candidate division TA06 bacterium]|nr:peroxiredoxin [candidate division TA06 bacterium]